MPIIGFQAMTCLMWKSFFRSSASVGKFRGSTLEAISWRTPQKSDPMAELL
ncbi:hypothetical protein [cyanobacterium endosymbiont of Rhopalodia gibberula]|uniref:hypothetical protein n=1 Tax=cyanobacterium endosymbiont of Rhopalodia gibberula TaxID=1763363 RepID=UPI0015599E39|nr:hypothetical protein [cyanobacterium endosymbiont of Rhopalodia gibberula]